MESANTISDEVKAAVNITTPKYDPAAAPESIPLVDARC